MNDSTEQILTDALDVVARVADMAGLENLETTIFGRKQGTVTLAMQALKDLSAEEKKVRGLALNAVKEKISAAIAEKKRLLTQAAWATTAASEAVDISQPALPKKENGHFHPNTTVQRELEDLFSSMGFTILDGPELESDFYNFTALNIPEAHPARDMQDTFYIKGHTPAAPLPSARLGVPSSGTGWVMRTHTTSVQVRAMQKYGAPLRVIVPGKCYRNESTDPRHEHTFYQLDGVVIDKNITFAHMKGVFQTIADRMFGVGTKIRLMPKFYPFVEPGVRGEVTCFLCKGVGCRVCKQSGWLEVMPGGMIHPNVLREGGLDPKVYQGFAFGWGLTRMTMLNYGIDDVRLLESGNMKFLEQF